MNQNKKNNQPKLKENEDNLNKSVETSKTEKRAKDLDNLNKNLMKKLYTDLFIKNTKLYKDKDLTFENFVYHFYKDFISLIDYENPNYKLLLDRMNLIIKSKFNRENKLDSGKNKLELIKELNFISQEDEWALIDKYQNALYKEEEQKLME